MENPTMNNTSIEKYLSYLVTIGERYHPLAVIGMAFCFAAFIALLVLGRKSAATETDPGLVFREWDVKIDPKSSTEKTAHFWPVLREMRSSLIPTNHFRLIYAATAYCKSDQGDLEVILRAREHPIGEDTYLPSLTAFLIRERNGYRQIVDVIQSSGFPDFTTSFVKLWTIKNYNQGERLELVALISVSSADKLSQIKALPASALVDTEIRPLRK